MGGIGATEANRRRAVAAKRGAEDEERLDELRRWNDGGGKAKRSRKSAAAAAVANFNSAVADEAAAPHPGGTRPSKRKLVSPQKSGRGLAEGRAGRRGGERAGAGSAEGRRQGRAWALVQPSQAFKRRGVHAGFGGEDSGEGEEARPPTP